MTTIYRPNFANRQAKVVVEQIPEPAPAVLDAELDEKTNQAIRVLMGDVEYLRDSPENTERVWKACKRAEEITNYIFSMFGFQKKDESVELRQSTFTGTSLCVLAGHLLDSHEHQWNTQAHYFGAIILEMNSRLNIIREAVDFEVPHFTD